MCSCYSHPTFLVFRISVLSVYCPLHVGLASSNAVTVLASLYLLLLFLPACPKLVQSSESTDCILLQIRGMRSQRIVLMSEEMRLKLQPVFYIRSEACVLKGLTTDKCVFLGL
jgi:hypothetical protein